MRQEFVGGDRGRQVIGNLSRVGLGQRVIAARDQRALPQREHGMQRREKFEKARGEIASRIEFRRSGIDRHDAIRKGQGSERRIRLGAAVAMVEVSPFRYEFERKPAGELERQFEGQPQRRAIPKIYWLKEIGEPRESAQDSVGKRGQRVEKIAHHRRVLSSPNLFVQHIEHTFSSLSLFYGAPPRPQDDVQYPEQLFYTWAITISYGGGHGNYGYSPAKAVERALNILEAGRATPRGTHQRGDQPQARDAEKLRELHFKKL